MNSFTDVNTDNDDIDNRSDVSNHTFSKSFGSSSSNLTHPGEHGSRVFQSNSLIMRFIAIVSHLPRLISAFYFCSRLCAKA